MDMERDLAPKAADYACGRSPQSEEEAELNRRLRGIKRDLLGGEQLGSDGVMRSFDADRVIIDAVGLSSEHIKIWFERLPPEMRKVFHEEKYRNVDGTYVDGTTVPRKEMLQYDKSLLPPSMPKEVQEEKRKKIAEEKEKKSDE
jgi:hypothetical protein